MRRPLATRRLAQIVEYLVDPRVGILRAVGEMRTEPGAPKFFHFAAQLCNTLAFSRQAVAGTTAAASADREEAAARAILDSVAYYCAAFRFEENELPAVCAASDADFPCSPPGELALFSHSQYEEPGFPWVAFDDATPVRWKDALDPLRDERIFVPAVTAFLPYAPRPEEGEAPIAPPGSTGLSCHWSPAAAAVEAICDVIECDALALLWQARLAPAQIRVETLSDANYELVARFERTGGFVTLFKVELGLGVTTILASLASAAPGAPARVFAAATDPDLERGVRKSLEMLAHALQYCQLIAAQMPRLEIDPEHRNIVDQASHLNFWCDHANASLADFLFASDERLEFDQLESWTTGEAEADLLGLLRRIEAAGYRTLLADLTVPDVGELGLTALRAVIPGLQPLFFGFRTRALGGSRLAELPPGPGLRGSARETGDAGLPHPFPRKGVVA